MEWIKASQELLLATKNQQPSEALRADMAEGSPTELEMELGEDAQRLAFWVNTYNAFVQIFMRNKVGQKRFFTAKAVPLAGEMLSLDDIEHGILRKNTFKYSLGYFKLPFVPPFLKTMQVEHLDWRIHFALNCGAASCPPVRFYEPERINEQLNTATQAYLEQECRRQPDGSLEISPLFRWYYGDFNGKQGILSILRTYGILAPEERPKIRFGRYDWSTKAGYFTEA